MIDFTRLCEEMGLPHLEEGHHHCHEGWVQTHCPFCTDGTYGWHLGFSVESGAMNCWRCGKHSVRNWLREVLPAHLHHTIPTTLDKYDLRPPRVHNLPTKTETRTGQIRPVPGAGPISQIHKQYLRNRGYNAKALEKTWSLLGTKHLSAEWNWRVIAPIKNAVGTTVAYTGRAVSPEVKPRWRTTTNSAMKEDPRRLLYGIEKLRPNQGVLIVEGPGDVWRMGPGAVALLGIDWKEEQAHILSAFPRRFIMFDPGVVEQRQANRLASWLAAMPGWTEIITGIDCDPGDMTQEEADQIMEELDL